MTSLVRQRYRRRSGSGGLLSLWYVQTRLGWVRASSGRVAPVRIPAFADRGESLRFARQVERLRQSKLHRRTIAPDLQQWVEQLAEHHRTKLAELGLVPAARTEASGELA